VAVLKPSAKIAARWHDALAARLRQAPLEAFLRSRGQPCTLAGDTRVTDNVATATGYLLQRAIGTRLDRAAAVGPLVCAVSDGLSALIREPSVWRVAALIATVRVLSPAIGLGAASDLAASAVREYSMSLGGSPLNPMLPAIRTAAARAVQSNDEWQVADVLQLISTLLLDTPVIPPAGEPRAANSS